MRLHVTVTLIALLLLLPLFTLRAQPAAQTALRPIFSHVSGDYAEAVTLAVRSPHPEAVVLVTADGRAPTPADRYTRPIVLLPAQVAVIRARLAFPDGTLGPVVSHSYFVGMQSALPLLSFIVAPTDLWNDAQGIYLKYNSRERGAEWERPVTAVYHDPEREAGFVVDAGLRIHGGASRRFDKKSFRLYFREQYGAGRLDFPLFDDGATTRFEQLVVHSGGQDLGEFSANWTLLHNRLMARLARDTNGYVPRNRPVLLFVNGRPWGIYYLRDRPDARFLQAQYGLQDVAILDSPDTGSAEEEGTAARAHWDHLLNFVATHDLADPRHYAYVQSQIDLESFIDYHLLQIYAANTDWPGHNYQVFRPQVQGGRWHWLFWDSDYTFGLQPISAAYPASLIEDDTLRRVVAHVDPAQGGRHTLLLRRLLANPAFRERFRQRMAVLLATTLSPQAVNAHVDALAAEIETALIYETGRWSPPTDWHSNVEALRHFADERPQIVWAQFEAYFE